MKISFLGIGVMGKSMAGHLLEAGHEITVYSRRKESAEELLKRGAKWTDTPSEAAKKSTVVISMLGYPNDVKEVYLGNDGVLSSKNGGIIIDMTTSSPSLAREIFIKAKEKGISSLDAPVSGGDIGAKEARLSIMVGGAKETYEEALPLFELMGKNIRYFGTAGAGQLTKLSNQIAIASNMLGVAEAITFAKKNGLDVNEVLMAISTGAAGSWSLSNLAPRMIAGDMAPGFFIKHFLKDMRLALEVAEQEKIELPGLKLAKSLYDELAQKNMADLGTQAIIKWYEENIYK